MAFPQIADADTKNGTVTGNSTSWTLTYPTNIAAGDLLIMLVATDGLNAGSTAPSGWEYAIVDQQTSAVTILCGRKLAAGSETGTFALPLSSSEQGSWRIFRVPAASWSGGSLPIFAFQGAQVDGDGLSALAAFGASINPNPPSLNPANWATEDTLWIAACAVDTSRTISVYPSNMPDRRTADVSGGAGGASLGVATAESAAASFDPATFTISNSDDWSALTIAIRPAAGGAATNANAGVATGSGAAI